MGTYIYKDNACFGNKKKHGFYYDIILKNNTKSTISIIKNINNVL